MKRRDFLRKSALVGGAIASYPFIAKCERDHYEQDISKDYVFNLKKLGSGFERPGGLSLYKNYKKSSLESKGNPNSLDELVFCSGPLFSFNLREFVPGYNPKIFRYSENIGDASKVQPLYEFGVEDIKDFLTGYTDIVSSMVIEDWSPYRPRGLVLDTLVLKDGTTLFVSNLSNKILDVTEGVKKTYLESDELLGISKMILANDGKIYCAQHPIRDSNSNIMRPKRVISIDSNKKINEEYILPEGVNSNLSEYLIDENGNVFGTLETGAQMRIIENLNPTLDKARFYLIDPFAQKIYKLLGDKQVSQLPNVIRYPSSLGIENIGRVLIVTPPIIKNPSDGTLAYRPQLIAINPATGEENILYTFGDGTDTKYQTGGAIKTISSIGGVSHLLPTGFYMSAGIVETDTKLDFYFTDSMTGDLGVLSTEKSSP